MKVLILLSLIFSLKSFSGIVCLDDPDNDGFAAENARTISASTSVGCWARGGVVSDLGIKSDCRPNDPDSYLHAPEKMDGIDNNCDGDVDEPRFIYSDNIPSKRGAPAINQLLIKVNSQRLHNLLSEGASVYYRLTFEPLNGERLFNFPSGGIREPIDSENYYSLFRTLDLGKNLRFDGLERFTAYKVTMFFFLEETGAAYQESADHYVITGGEAGNSLTDLERFRLKMGLNALIQLGDQKLGKVGVNGTVDEDGTRYGARKGGTWCDEFWTWLALEASDGDGFNDINPDNVPGYFRNPKGDDRWKVYHEDPKQRVADDDNQFFNDGRGKWGTVFYDPIKGNPKYGSMGDMLLGPSHVFMLLSTDHVNNKIWTIDGNASNQVKIRRISVFNELPDPYGDDLPSRKSAVGIGRLKRYMFTQGR